MNSLQLKNEIERTINLQYKKHGLFTIDFNIAEHRGTYFIQGSYTGSPTDSRGFFACLEISKDLAKMNAYETQVSNNLHALNWQDATEIPNMHIMLSEQQSSANQISSFIVTTLEVGLGLKAQDIQINY